MIFFAMATRHMILQSILFLKHVKQELIFLYDDMRYLYKCRKVAIILLQNT